MRTTTPLLLLLLLSALPASARVKLAALPPRERVEIQLDDGRYTLVEEERIVPLLAWTPEAGNNHVDFSWANAQVDKDSVLFRPVAVREGDAFRPLKDEEVKVVNVAYPPNENALVFEVYAKQACAAKVRVSYLIRNLGRTFAYRAVADRDERFLALKTYLVIGNRSGEEFAGARVWAGIGPRLDAGPDDGDDVRLLVDRADRVPVRKTFTFDWYTHGPLSPEKPFASKVLMHYALRNDEKNGLGRFPLPPGKARVFLDDGRGGEAFLGEDWVGLTPLDREARIFLGEARDVVCMRTIERNERRPVEGNLFHQEVTLRYEIENFRDKPATLDIVEQLNRLAADYGTRPPGDVEWELLDGTTDGIALSTDRGSALPVLSVDLAPRPKEGAVEKRVVILHILLKNLW
ncbi:MAG TPA: hypothetical protein VFY93_04405 [Planctomycetota bacterium]|nr:hypothetical protein [Planctomycetota bacterium]